MRALAILALLMATPSYADWRVETTWKSGSMPWGVLATTDAIYVGHVGYRDHDNVWKYDRDGRVLARAQFPGHVVELARGSDRTLYAGNSRVDRVMALDPDTLAVRTSFRTGSGPKDLCVGASRLYAGNFNTNTVSAIDLATGKEQRIVVGAGPRGLDLVGDRLYVASLRASTVSVIDTKSLAVTSTIRGCKGAAHTAPAGKLLLVTCYGARHVQVIDTATDRAVRMIEVGAGPNPIAITPDGTQALVGNEFADSLSVIDLATWQVSTLPLPIDRPVGVIVAPDGKAYVTGRGSTRIVILAR